MQTTHEQRLARVRSARNRSASANRVVRSAGNLIPGQGAFNALAGVSRSRNRSPARAQPVQNRSNQGRMGSGRGVTVASQLRGLSRPDQR